MLYRSIIFSGFVICLFATVYAARTHNANSKYKNLINRYVANRQERPQLMSRPGFYWLCKRGNTVAVCGDTRRKSRASSARARNSNKRLSRTSRGARCDKSTCKNGDCIFGKCRCQRGWIGRQCSVDKNECRRSNHKCAQICINLPGSYKCSCKAGFKLQSNGKHCMSSELQESFAPAALRERSMINVPAPQTTQTTNPRTIDPKSLPPRPRYRGRSSLHYKSEKRRHSCKKACRYNCLYADGEESCFCPNGFTLSPDEVSCIDVNECLDIGSFKCPVNHECVNTFGGYNCQCKAGYIKSYGIEGKTCIDLNECLSVVHDCDFNSTCINTIGSYTCHCKEGFVKFGRKCISNSEEVILDSKPVIRYEPTYRAIGVRKPSNDGADLN